MTKKYVGSKPTLGFDCKGVHVCMYDCPCLAELIARSHILFELYIKKNEGRTKIECTWERQRVRYSEKERESKNENEE